MRDPHDASDEVEFSGGKLSCDGAAADRTITAGAVEEDTGDVASEVDGGEGNTTFDEKEFRVTKLAKWCNYCDDTVEVVETTCCVCLEDCHSFCSQVSGVCSTDGHVKRVCLQCRPANKLTPPFKVQRVAAVPDMFVGEILWKYVQGLACSDRDPFETDQLVTSIGFVAGCQQLDGIKPVRIFWISDREPTMWQVKFIFLIIFTCLCIRC